MTLGPRIGYVPGVFDLLHIGHLNVLRQARELCDVLVAGVVSDAMCELAKGVAPFVPLEERLAIVDSIGIVDATYAEHTPDKVDAWAEVGFHRLYKGDDWKDTERGRRLERQLTPHGVEIVYFPYTLQTSSTDLRTALAAGRSAS
jgi:glycerol-3-phosphate cytidylyltransferase